MGKSLMATSDRVALRSAKGESFRSFAALSEKCKKIEIMAKPNGLSPPLDLLNRREIARGCERRFSSGKSASRLLHLNGRH